jgi:hypothetical protein
MRAITVEFKPATNTNGYHLLIRSGRLSKTYSIPCNMTNGEYAPIAVADFCKSHNWYGTLIRGTLETSKGYTDKEVFVWYNGHDFEKIEVTK